MKTATPTMKNLFRTTLKRSLALVVMATLNFSGFAQVLKFEKDLTLMPNEDAVNDTLSLENDFVFDPEFRTDKALVDFRAALSGDTVGNGYVIDNENHGTIDFDDIFLNPSVRESRNLQFKINLDSIGIDPRNIRSGDTVGNGGGLLEAQVSFYYHNLAKHIISSFEQSFVNFDENENKVLLDILNILSDYEGEGKVIFLSEADYPDFFHLKGFDPAPRVAKTGFSSEFPIFINRDLAYRRMDNPRLWIGLLIHELGHQVGVGNHTFLEELGTKVINVSEVNKAEIEMTITEDLIVGLGYYNHDFVDGVPDLYVTYGEKLHRIEGWSNQGFREVCGKGLYYGGVSISNLHWKDRGLTDMVYDLRVTAGGWASVKCLDKAAGVYYNEYVDIEVVVNIGDGPMNTEVKIK